MFADRRPSACAVIFDLDGTLTEPFLDFDQIRREIGLPATPRTPVLEALTAMPAVERARAEAILHRHEDLAARQSRLRDGAAEVIAALRGRCLPVGVLTRNSRPCTDIVLRLHGLTFDCIHTREDGLPKPSPEPILGMCRRWQVNPAAAWMVGDYLFDVQAGRAAGATTVLIVDGDPVPEFAPLADHVIRDLRELLALLGLS